jgi:hypothetical protein
LTEQELDEALEHARLDEKLTIARQADEAPDKSSAAGAAMRGGARGITFGLADEAYGLVGSLWNPANMKEDPKKSTWENFKDRYAASRDYAREHDEQAAEEHPIAFHGAELAGSIASPVSKIMAPAEGAGVLSSVGSGAAAGALSGFGGSTADNPEDLAAQTAGGAALGGFLGGTTRLASDFLGKLTPDNLRQTGTRLMAKSAGAKGMELERAAPLLSAADEAGPAVVGYGSKASDIAESAAAKARYFGEATPAEELKPVWQRSMADDIRAVRGRAEAEAANASKAQGYQSIAASATKRAEDQGANSSDFALPGMGMMASFMSGHGSLKHMAAMAALGVGKKAVRERGASFAGRAAFDAGEAMAALPEEVGTVAGAANQFLGSGMGGQAVTEQAMGMAPESAADMREKRLRDVMVKRLRDLSNQGYASPTPRIVPQSP